MSRFLIKFLTKFIVGSWVGRWCWVASSADVLLLLHMVGQGPAVLAAGAGWVGCFFVFLFHLVYPIFFFKCLISWETARHTEICGLGRYNPMVVVSCYRRRAH